VVKEGTLRVQATNSRSSFEVTTDGTGVVGHAGAALLRDLADRVELTRALGWQQPGERRRHPDPAVLRDLAVLLADGSDCLSDLAVLRDQPALFGPVASTATAWRVVERAASDPDGLARLRAARAHARGRAWAAGGDPDVELLIIDADATLVLAHSDAKQGAAGTYKHTFGFAPLLAYLDRGHAPGELLAGILRPGNAPAGAAADPGRAGRPRRGPAARRPAAGAGAKRQRRRQQQAGLAPARARCRLQLGDADRRPCARGDLGRARARLDTRGRA
jgi:Transposase DDE domain group 1